MNYLSLCIANLGVVPLFSLAFFLFLPALFSFSFLLVRVFIVLDPILLSSTYLKLLNNRKKYLTFTPQLVKIFMTFILITPSVYAKNYVEVFLSKGEQTEINVKSLKSYSVGNKEVISALHRKKTKKLLVKGKSIGFSDLIVWDKDGKRTYKIHITSKREQLNKMQILTALRNTHLNIGLEGEWITVDGKVTNLKDYRLLKRILQKKKKQLIASITLSKKFKNMILQEVYSQLYSDGVNSVQCTVNILDIACELSDPKRLGRVGKLEHQYDIKFTYQTAVQNDRVYSLNFKIFSLETNNNKNHNSGIHKLEGSLEKLINSKDTKLNSENFLYQEGLYKFELIATPTFNIVLDKSFKFSMGQEIPFVQTTAQTTNTQWKFSGIKLQGKVTEKNGHSLMTIKSQITTPLNGSIQGPMNETSFFIQPDRYQKVFRVDLSSKLLDTKSIPVINQIPILKALFTKSHQSNSHKSLYIYVTLSEKKYE